MYLYVKYLLLYKKVKIVYPEMWQNMLKYTYEYIFRSNCTWIHIDIQEVALWIISVSFVHFLPVHI